MGDDELVLTELESKIVFLAELAEKSGSPFFHHGVYRGEIVDDMLVLNSSIFLSINYDQCNGVVKKLQEKGILRIHAGTEGARAYKNYYYYVTDFTDKEKTLERIGNTVLKDAINLVSENIGLMETLGCALVYRYKGWKYTNEEKISIDPEFLDISIKNCILMKNRFVYTGTASGINYFIPDAPFFKLLGSLNTKFLDFFFTKLQKMEAGIVNNYEELRRRILSDSSLQKLGLDNYDTQVIDYIFELAESLQIHYATRYKRLYDRYKESVISSEKLEKLSPLLCGAIETLEDSIKHFKKETISDYRLALINIDNSIELMFRNHVLKKSITAENVRKMTFESLLKKCSDIKIVSEEIEKFRQIHEARNQLYHMPVLGVFDKIFLKNAIILAKDLFETETSERLKIDV